VLEFTPVAVGWRCRSCATASHASTLA
jgi:hypothetical protein